MQDCEKKSKEYAKKRKKKQVEDPQQSDLQYVDEYGNPSFIVKYMKDTRYRVEQDALGFDISVMRLRDDCYQTSGNYKINNAGTLAPKQTRFYEHRGYEDWHKAVLLSGQTYRSFSNEDVAILRISPEKLHKDAALMLRHSASIPTAQERKMKTRILERWHKIRRRESEKRRVCPIFKAGRPCKEGLFCHMIHTRIEFIGMSPEDERRVRPPLEIPEVTRECNEEWERMIKNREGVPKHMHPCQYYWQPLGKGCCKTPEECGFGHEEFGRFMDTSDFYKEICKRRNPGHTTIKYVVRASDE